MDVKFLTQQPQVHIYNNKNSTCNLNTMIMTVTGAVSYSCVSMQFQSH